MSAVGCLDLKLKLKQALQVWAAPKLPQGKGRRGVGLEGSSEPASRGSQPLSPEG